MPRKLYYGADFNGHRGSNGADAVDAKDFVTLQQLNQVNSKILVLLPNESVPIGTPVGTVIIRLV